MEREALKSVLEALIFAADHPVGIDRLASVLEGESREEIKAALGELREEYSARRGGLTIEEVAGGFQLRTRPEHAPWLRRFFKVGMQRISKAALESLSIVAYKQPLTRAGLESVRGVDSAGVLKTLLEKRLVKIVGRQDAPGRPVVYGTTKEFLETFDLKDLSGLPTLKEIEALDEGEGEGEGDGYYGEAEADSPDADKGRPGGGADEAGFEKEDEDRGDVEEDEGDDFDAEDEEEDNDDEDDDEEEGA